MSGASQPTLLISPEPDEAAIYDTLYEGLRALMQLSGRRCEVGRRTPPEHDVAFRGPDEVAEWLGPQMEDLAQEQLRVVLLDTKNRVIKVILAYQGSINSIGAIRPADVYRDAVATGAAAVVLVHNHPSSDVSPSADDIHTTRLLGQAGALLGVDLLDHLIIGKGRWFSLARERLYRPPARDEERHGLDRAA